MTEGASTIEYEWMQLEKSEKSLKSVCSSDEQRRVIITAHPEGCYQFRLFVWRFYENDGSPEGWWQIQYGSGLYDTAERAEKEALLGL